MGKGGIRRTRWLSFFHRAREIGPDYPQTHNNIGITLRDLGRLAEAITEIRKAISIKPDYAEAHSNLGNAGEFWKASRGDRDQSQGGGAESRAA